MYFMAGFARNRKTRRATWEYMKKNFTSMEERFKGNFTRLLSSLRSEKAQKTHRLLLQLAASFNIPSTA